MPPPTPSARQPDKVDLELDVSAVDHADAAAISTGHGILDVHVGQLEGARTGPLDGAAADLGVAIDERQPLEGQAAAAREGKEPRPTLAVESCANSFAANNKRDIAAALER